MKLFVLALFVAVAAGNAISLTSANYDDVTAGKSSFIKFQAPW
jgi:hypothetical protein